MLQTDLLHVEKPKLMRSAQFRTCELVIFLLSMGVGAVECRNVYMRGQQYISINVFTSSG